MAGGLIQLVTSGQQDVALTYKPEITFFKKRYSRHTNFSLELKEIYPEQEPSFGDKVSFLLTNGDLIHRCFVQVEIPSLTFTDSIIKNQDYLTWKNNYILKLNKETNKWYNLYNNFKNYVSIELLLYQQLLTLFLSDNVTLNNMKEAVVRFNNSYKSQKSVYINLIDVELYNQINMSGYILSINSLLSYDLTVPNSNYISIYTIKETLNLMNNKMQEYLLFYHTNWRESQKIYNEYKSGTININFAWTQYLGHFYFSLFELDIGGQVTEQYSSDQFHIYQHHHLREEQINNYNIMIGHDVKLYEFNSNTKPSKILIIPLIFFFNKNPGSSLPLVAMRNTSVSISLTINKLKNLIYFRDWETEYNSYCILKTDYTNQPNSNLNYNNYTYDPISKKITYNLSNINFYALQFIYPQLKDDDLNFILTTFGNNNLMYLNDWIYFKNNLYKYPVLQTKIGSYDSYIDYNYLLNLIPKPKIKLLAEYVFLDDVERKKFTSSKLEYVIEGFQENIFDVNNLQLFDGEISIDRPNKYLKWFLQPKNFLNGLSEYGKVTPYLYNYSKYYVNNIFNKQIITLNQIELLNQQIDKTFYNYVQSYETLNRVLPDQVYYFTFSLYPEEIQPSGTVNLTVLKEKKFRYEMNQEFLKEYFTTKLNPNNVGLQLKVMSCSYNFFVVQNGIGRIIFSIS
jgi:hypothetical protein